MSAASDRSLVLPLIDWEFRSVGDSARTHVRLPHDAMIAEGRGPDSPGGADVGWFRGGRYEYRTTWRPDAALAAGHPVLRFEGVQGDAEVSFNGTPLGVVRSGYFETELPLGALVRWDRDNEIVVHVDNSRQPASRWYPGSGLYRPVAIIVRPVSHFPRDGVRLITRSLSAAVAEVEVDYDVEGATAGTEVVVELVDAGTVVGSCRAAADVGRISLRVENPRLWTAETPELYELVARLEVAGSTVDTWTERVGLRTISVDARRGLRVNGASVFLRGACIHHDNGVLGAATHRAAEFRRVRLLKEAGFNAIRSAHHPMSRHLLDACDQHGMYVLEEFADYWVAPKSAHDAAPRFAETWREDARSMIAKDRNRPSVIMYAIGNEIPETAKPEGVALARELAEFFRAADPERPVTVAVNLFLNTLVSLDLSPYKQTSPGAEQKSMAGSTEANVMINQIGRMMDVISRLPRADKASRDVFEVVDVAGYNYGLGRYDRDVRSYPDRVILGTETLPGDVPRAWALVRKHPAIIGDFVWAGWDFLGEAGVAVWVPGRRAGLSKPYPYVLHGGGMFDLIGKPDVSLRLAQATWGRLGAPAIAVRPLDRSGQPMVRSAWRSTDAVESWSWRGCEGRLAEIDVYSADDEVELFLNGRSLGRRRTGERRGFRARFRTRYEPGSLVAVGYRDGRETVRSELRSAAGSLGLRVSAEAPHLVADADDLAFIDIAITDDEGTVEMLADESIQLSVSGPAELVGFGTANPAPTEEFTGDRVTTFRGRAQAVLRSTGEPGNVVLRVGSATLGIAQLAIPALAAREASEGRDIPREARRSLSPS